MNAAGTPAGWYRQPDGTQRYWTGTAWSEHLPPPRSSEPYGGMVPLGTAPMAGARPPQLAYTPQGYVPVTQVAPKSPGLSLIASFFIPGLGQMINGRAGKGVAMFLGYVFSYVLMVVFIGFITAFAIWIWSMVDAYSGAQQWNARHGILS